MEISCDYLSWLYSLIEDTPDDREYSRLLNQLGSTVFTPENDMDTNRVIDGLNLRTAYCKTEYSTEYDRWALIHGPMANNCSVLEMMISLAIRGERYIMDDPDLGDRTSLWFWGMINNLGLIQMTNSNYNFAIVSNTIDQFQNHEYCSNGHGGLFTITKRQDDMRCVDIWTQMQWYFAEQF